MFWIYYLPPWASWQSLAWQIVRSLFYIGQILPAKLVYEPGQPLCSQPIGFEFDALTKIEGPWLKKRLS